MLVLTRKVGETICIGDTVTVTVVEAGGFGRVRLGVNAPRDVRVDRLEVSLARKQAQAKEGSDAADQKGQ